MNIANRMFKKANLLTHPTPVRPLRQLSEASQDAPFRGQGRSKRKAEAYAVGTLRP